MSEAIADAAMRTAQLAGDCADEAPSPASSALLALLRKSYTMEAERRIHDGFAGTPDEPVAAEDSDGLF